MSPNRGRIVAVTIVTMLSFAGCSRAPRGLECPGQFDPSHMSTAQLRQSNIGLIPRQGSTSLMNLRRAEKRSRQFIKNHYDSVVEIGLGRGWGTTYSLDQFGNQTFHRVPDHMVVVVVGKRSDCPDPDRGTLFVFGEGDLRAPVRFLYRRSG